MDKARAMVAHAGLSKGFWAEAVNTANYLRNRSPCQTLRGHITSYEAWHGKKPDIAHLHTFGCIAYARIPDRKCTKLDDKVEHVRFLGYSKGGKGYRLLEEVGNRVKHRRDVTFDETRFVFTVPVPSKETVDHVSNQYDRMEADQTVGARPEEPMPEGARPKTVNPVGVREAAPPEAPTKVVERAQRHCPKIKRWGIDEVYLSEMNFVHSAFSAEVVPEPITMIEALSSPESERWREATQAEFDSLKEHDTWDLCELPPGRKLIGSKWVFKVKYGESGKIDRFCVDISQFLTLAQTLSEHG